MTNIYENNEVLLRNHAVMYTDIINVLKAERKAITPTEMRNQIGVIDDGSGEKRLITMEEYWILKDYAETVHRYSDGTLDHPFEVEGAGNFIDDETGKDLP